MAGLKKLAQLTNRKKRRFLKDISANVESKQDSEGSNIQTDYFASLSLDAPKYLGVLV